MSFFLIILFRTPRPPLPGAPCGVLHPRQQHLLPRGRSPQKNNNGDLVGDMYIALKSTSAITSKSPIDSEQHSKLNKLTTCVVFLRHRDRRAPDVHALGTRYYYDVVCCIMLCRILVYDIILGCVTCYYSIVFIMII